MAGAHDNARPVLNGTDACRAASLPSRFGRLRACPGLPFPSGRDVRGEARGCALNVAALGACRGLLYRELPAPSLAFAWGATLDAFVIERIGHLWTVTSAEVLVAQRRSAPDAIRAAVEAASRYASYGRDVQVVLDDPDDGQVVVWDSTRDGYSKG